MPLVKELLFSSYNDTLQVLGTCRSLSLSSDLKSLSVITEVRSADNNPEICYIQVRWMVWASFFSSCKLAFSSCPQLYPYLRFCASTLVIAVAGRHCVFGLSICTSVPFL